MDTWLEVRPCAVVQAVHVNSRMLAIPALAEAMQAVQDAARRGGMWDYSRKLNQGEVAQLQSAIQFSSPVEDDRSVSLAADVEYNGHCYSLTLFSAKTQ